jgi:NADH-quinone oxidoreductase subunit C
MTAAELLTELQRRHGAAIVSVAPDAPNPVAVVEANAIAEVSRTLRDEFQFDLLNSISGVDYLETDPKKLAKSGFEPHLEVVYHLSSFAHPGRRIALKVLMPRDGQPELPSVSGVWRTADWHERETWDLFGIRFTGHPNLTRILLSDDWVGHPLRKDYEFPLEYHDIRCR